MARSVRSIVVAAVGLGCALIGGIPAAHAAGDFQVTVPAGLACPAFALGIAGSGGNATTRSFVNGRTVSAGTGSALVFTNLSNGNTLTLRSNGAPQQTTTNEDGTQTVTAEGHQVVILFPTDSPAGPSTTLVVGRVVYEVDSAGNFTVLSVNGQTSDICAGLS